MKRPKSGESPGGRPHGAEEHRAALEGLQASAIRKVRLDTLRVSRRGDSLPDADAARSQDFLYDEFGLPEGGGDFATTDTITALPKS
jgi:hypothetical protein